MTADYAALESRVAELEQQMRHMLPGKIDAVGYGVSLVHEDTQAIRAELGTVRGELATVRGELATVRADLGTELATVRADLGTELATVRTDLGTELGTVRTEQARHGELLEQILLRLPDPST